MEPIQLSIPSTFKSPLSKREEDQAFAANVWRALKEIGVDPYKILCPAFYECAKLFKSGEWTKSQFQNAVNNVAILRGLK